MHALITSLRLLTAISYQIAPKITSILWCFVRLLSAKAVKHSSFPLQTGADSLSVRTSTIASLSKTSYSTILVVSRTQCAQASIHGYVQGFPETTLLKPAPPPSEKLHIEHA